MSFKTEAEVTFAVRSTLNVCNVPHWKIWQGPMSTPGVSDILAVRPFKVEKLVEMGLEMVGVFCALEIKKPSWKIPGPETKAFKHYSQQRAFIEKVQRAGGIGGFIQSPEQVVKLLMLEGNFLF